MNKVYRKGVDLGVAFASAAERRTKILPNSAVAPHLSHVELSSIEETVTTPENKAPQANHVEPDPPQIEPSSHPEVTNAPEHGEMHKPSRTKALLRPVARFVYRLFRPAFRPVAFRLRRYLVESLHQDVLKTHTLSVQELQRISADLLQEIQTARESLRQDVLSTPAQSLQELQRISADLLQEMQTARESLRQDVLNTHALSLQELQRVSAGMLQETQATRESLRQDVLNTHELSLQELQRVSAGMLQVLQTTRELLRQDVQAVQKSLQCELEQQTNHFQPAIGRIEQYSLASARRIAVSCANNEILIRSEVGYVVCSSSDNSTMAHLIENGEAERGIRLLIQKLLRPGSIFFDIGANLGLHTLAAARVVGSMGRVVAFEPFKETVELLKKNIWMNGLLDRVEVNQKAVSNTTGICKLFLGVGSAQHSLYPLSVPDGFESQSVEVPMVRLDDYVDRYPQIDLIKIDAEGAELDILSGARDIIIQNPEVGIIAEFGPSHLCRSGHTTKGWIAEFENLGMVHKVINTDTGSTYSLTIADMEQLDIVNILFARPNAALWKIADAV